MLDKSRLKYIQSLGQKKVRDQDGLFVAEGPKLVSELLSSSRTQLVEILALKQWLEEHDSVLKDIHSSEISEDELAKISQLATPNQVLAIMRRFDQVAVNVKGSLVLALDTIQDPGNLGTILRIADWFGIGQVVCSRECADLYNPKVVQSTMGSIARVNVVYTDLVEWLESQDNTTVFAAVLDGEPVNGMKKPQQGILLIGNESKGVSPALLKKVDKKITIPRKGHAESLNAAVATGILLSHLVG